ncbi:MAG: hypothetical protein LBT54_01315, partial [Bifidobacteriaceae bacterium]|nr:hypothetical protein [Bifidobacteriaceae bacterium]
MSIRRTARRALAALLATALLGTGVPMAGAAPLPADAAAVAAAQLQGADPELGPAGIETTPADDPLANVTVRPIDSVRAPEPADQPKAAATEPAKPRSAAAPAADDPPGGDAPPTLESLALPYTDVYDAIGVSTDPEDLAGYSEDKATADNFANTPFGQRDFDAGVEFAERYSLSTGSTSPDGADVEGFGGKTSQSATNPFSGERVDYSITVPFQPPRDQDG